MIAKRVDATEEMNVEVDVEPLGGDLFSFDVTFLSATGVPMMGGGADVSKDWLTALAQKIGRATGTDHK